MLNIFPSFLDFALLAPFVLRVVVGVLFIKYGFYKIKLDNSTPVLKTVGFVEWIGGVFLVIGLFTQASALVLLLLTLTAVYLKKTGKIETSFHSPFYALIISILISLLLTGAGAYAFDIPL